MKFKFLKWEVTISVSRIKEVQPFNSKPSKKRRKRQGIKYCDVVDKVQYTEALAKLKAKNFKKKGQYMRAYCCEFCNQWHLTHKKSYLKMINR